MVEVCVADEQNLDVAKTKAELFDARLDLGYGGFEVAIDQDVALGSRDEERSEVPAADVVEIAGDPVRVEGLLPFRSCLRESACGIAEREYEGSKKHGVEVWHRIEGEAISKAVKMLL
jgi:hypothetical protein